MNEEKQGNAMPPKSDTGDTTPKSNNNREEMIPKSRFDEINSRMKTAEEQRDLYKSSLDQTKAETEEARQQKEAIEQKAKEIEKQAWKERALRSINPTVAKLSDELGINFNGESEEDYQTWAKSLESKMSAHIRSDKSNVDGNRSQDGSIEITAEQLLKMTPEERLEYGKKVLPRIER